MYNYFTWPLILFTGSIAGSILGTSIKNVIYNKKSTEFFNNGFFIGLTIGAVRAYTGKPIIEYFFY